MSSNNHQIDKSEQITDKRKSNNSEFLNNKDLSEKIQEWKQNSKDKESLKGNEKGMRAEFCYAKSTLEVNRSNQTFARTPPGCFLEGLQNTHHFGKYNPQGGIRKCQK